MILSITLLSFLVPLGMFNFPTVKATTQSNAACPQSSVNSVCEFNYLGFSSTTGLSLNGNAQQAGGTILRLTPATPTSQVGSAWYDVKQNLTNGFRTTFRFQITSPGGGDGFAFVIQNSNTSALGVGGGGLGYEGITSSLAVEFDTYQNGAHLFDQNLGDISDHEIAVHTNDLGPNSPSESFALPPGPIISPIAFQNDQLDHAVKVVYELGVLEVFFDDFSKPVLSLAVNLGSTLGLSDGTAYVGFTGATGGQTENNDILDWIFYTQTPSSNIVENGDFSNDLLGWTPISVTTVRGARGELPMFQALTEMPAPSKCTPLGRRGTSFLAIDAAFGASGYVEQQVTIPSSGAQLTLTSWGWENDNPQLGTSGISNASVRIVGLTGTQLFSDSFTPPPMLNLIDPSNPAAFACTGNSPVPKSYDLSALAGQTVKLRLGSQSNNCCGTLTAFADVYIETPGIAAFHCPPLAGYQATSDSCALPNATPGKLYTYNLQVTGGVPPYDFSYVSGGLPTGLILESNGNIQGTTISTGVFREDLIIQDQGITPPIPVSITITVPPVVTGVSPAAGPVGGGTSINITGIGFSQTSSISFNATMVSSSSYHIQSDNVIDIDSTPPSQVACGFLNLGLCDAPGIDNVTVAVNNHQSGSWCPREGCNQFTYIRKTIDICGNSALPTLSDDNVRFHTSYDASIAVADAELSGSIAIHPNIGFCLHTVDGQLKSLNFTTTVDTLANLSASVSLTAQYDNSGKPYVIAGPFSGAPIVAGPIIIVPTITPVFVVNASLSGEISGGFSLSSEKTFGLTYNVTSSKWITTDSTKCLIDPVTGKTATLSTLCVQPRAVSMTIQGNVEIAVGVQFSFLLYDIAGPVVTPDVFLRLDAGYSSAPGSGGSSCDGLQEGTQSIGWGALCGGLEVRVGVQLNPWLDWLLPTTNWSLPPFPVKSVLLAASISATPSVMSQPDGSFKLSPGQSTSISVLVAGSYLPSSLSATSSWNLNSFSQTCGNLARVDPGTFVYTAPPNYGESCNVQFTKNFLGLNVWISAPLVFQIPPIPPTAPLGISASAQSGHVMVQWNVPSFEGGSPVTGYNLYRGTSPGSESFVQNLGDVLSFSDSLATCQITYYYRVSAVNVAGESPQSVEVSSASLCAPSAPASLAVEKTANGITLNWQTPMSDGGSSITGYKLYRGTVSGGEILLQTLGDVLSFSDSSVVCQASYYYKVSALNSAGESSQSTEIFAAAICLSSAPQNLVASSSTNGIVLNWQAPTSDGGSPITGYIIYRGTSSGQETVLVRIGVSTSFNDTSVLSGTTYIYKVVAVNDAGTSESSNEVSSSTIYHAPPNQEASPVIFYSISGVVTALIAAIAVAIFLRRRRPS